MSCDSFRTPELRIATPGRDSGHARSHTGLGDALSRRHARECERYGRMAAAEQSTLLDDLLMRIADTRTLVLAAQRLAENGEKAAGPNRQQLKTLLEQNPKRVRAELRRLARELREGTYRPGPTREVEIPKSSGRGTRTIAVANWQDQVVQRAIVDILQPLLDPGFEDFSYGFRPKRALTDAKARAAALVETLERPVVITADVQNAFDNIPHRQLFETLRKKLPEDVVRLIETVATANRPGQRGVPQGGPLSPLLLNVYLDSFVDKKWQHPECPMIRVADDILILCQDREQAQTCYRNLHGLVRTAGMKLKGRPETDISDLAAGDTADWLGTTLTWRNKKLVYGIPDRYWKRLKQHLKHLLTEADGPALIWDCLQAVLVQLGPCYKGADKSEVYRHMAKITHELGMPEVRLTGNLKRVWRKSSARYLTMYELWKNRQPISPTEIDSGQGSAAGQPTRSNATDKTPDREHPTSTVGASVQRPHGIGCRGTATTRPGPSQATLLQVFDTGLNATTTRERGRRAAGDVLASLTGGRTAAQPAPDNLPPPPDQNPEETVSPKTLPDFATVARQLKRTCRPRRYRRPAKPDALQRSLLSVLPACLAAESDGSLPGPSG